VNAAHPGLVASNFAVATVEETAELCKSIPLVGGVLAPVAKGVLGALRGGVMATGWTPDDGALTPVYLAASPEVTRDNIRGKFYVPIAQLNERTSKLARNAKLQKDFWAFSDRLVAEKGY